MTDDRSWDYELMLLSHTLESVDQCTVNPIGSNHGATRLMATQIFNPHADNMPINMSSLYWRSTKDSYPPPGISVLVFVRTENAHRNNDCVCLSYFEDNMWKVSLSGDLIIHPYDVKLWMPLPEPPK